MRNNNTQKPVDGFLNIFCNYFQTFNAVVSLWDHRLQKTCEDDSSNFCNYFVIIFQCNIFTKPVDQDQASHPNASCWRTFKHYTFLVLKIYSLKRFVDAEIFFSLWKVAFLLPDLAEHWINLTRLKNCKRSVYIWHERYFFDAVLPGKSDVF